MSDLLGRVEGLWKTFSKGGKQINVLQGASLEIRNSDRIAIVGKSGSGKSTFLHILGTLERPSRGDIWIRGQQVFSMPQSKIDAIRNHQIGFVFQFHHLLPDHTALRNVMMPMLIAGKSISAAEKRGTELLEKVGLGPRLSHRPGELSGGEQQRVAIARAMVFKPALLLADEPTGNLDPRTAAEIMGLLLDLNAETGSALVMVTHDHTLARQCPRFLSLEEGVFVEGAIS